MRWLFEHPWGIVAATAGVALVFAVIWRLTRARWSSRGAWITLAAGAAALMLERAVVTPTEQLTARCRDLARWVESADLARVHDALAEDLHTERLNRDELMVEIERALTRYHPEEAKLSDFTVKLASHDMAVVEFRSTCRVTTQSEVIHGVIARWRIGFARRSGDWLVDRIEVLPDPVSPLHTLDDIIR